MSLELLTPGTGYAIVGRYVYDSPNTDRQIQSVDTYGLSPGEGILFIGNGDNPEDAIRFKQSELSKIVQETDLNKIQLLVIVEMRSGKLLITDIAGENKIGIGKEIPKSQRVVTARYGRITFTGIWGETKKEATSILEELQRNRLQMN